MECARRGCSRTAVAGSNYCSLHKPHRAAGRKYAKKKVAKKK